MVAKLTHPATDYDFARGFTTAATAHSESGQCYSNTAEHCPNLPAAYTMIDASNSAQPPSGQDLVEVYGTITALNNQTLQLTSSSGRIWTTNIGPIITDANRLGLSIGLGDHLRVEAWLPPGQSSATINSPSIRMLQLALKQPWHYGQTIEKY